MAHLTELLTRYGEIAEVWFDGANGEGPNGRKQVYDWPRVFRTVRRLQPRAVMFSDAGPDVRWIGNEAGSAGDPNWSTVNPDAVPFPGATGDAVTTMLQHGDPAGTAWRPGETDTSIRPGWFYHAAEDDRVRTGDELADIYFASVGRNSKLLLNVPPTRDGLLHPTDVAHLTAMHDRLAATFAHDLAAAARRTWKRTGERSATLDVDLGTAVAAGVARLEEAIATGQRVSRYVLSAMVDGAWQELSHGQTIGYCKLDRFRSRSVSRVRLEVETIAAPRRVSVRLFA